MNKIKKYFNKIIKILSLDELRILPAYLSYSFVLAIFPIFTIIVIVAGYFSISVDSIIGIINDFLPSYASNIITNIISGESFDFSIGFLNFVTFIIAANGMYAIVNASNSLYKIKDTSQIRDRLRSFIILFVIICLLLFLIVVPMLGDRIIEILGNYEKLTTVTKDVILLYRGIKWPITFFIIFFNIKLIYAIAPSVRIPSEETTIGAFIATVGWLCFTAIFGYYIKYMGRYDLIYGGLSGIAILLIWIYILSFILILGIVINNVKYNNN